MDSMRKIFFVSMTLVLAAFALPSVADNGKKTFNLQMRIVSPPTQTTAPFTVSATITNQGNSTLNSFSLFATGLTIVGADPPAAGTFPGASVSVKNMHPLKSGQSFTVTLSVSSCGDGQWSAAAWTGSSLTGQSFNLIPDDPDHATSIPCGSLASGDSFTVPDSLNPDCVTGQRGFYDKDGSIFGSTLPFFVTNTVSTNDQLHFRWPDDLLSGDPRATFEYTVCGSGPLPAPGVAQVAWLNTDGSAASTPGTPAYVEAQDCLDPDQLPAPYGTLLSDLGPGLEDTVFTVNALSPSGAHGSIAHSLPPFDIVIGTERMTVTDVASDDGEGGDLADSEESGEGNEVEVETWTVVRAVGGTAAAAHSASAATLLMSTPLPLLPAGVALPYTPGNQAQVCIANEFESEDHQSHSTTFIDIGDGWVKGP